MLAAGLVFSIAVVCVFGVVFATAWHFRKRRPAELRRTLTWAQAAVLATAFVCGAAGAALSKPRPSGTVLAQALFLSAAFAVPLLATGATRGQERMGIAVTYLGAVALGLPLALMHRVGCYKGPACAAAVTLALVYVGIAVASAAVLGEDPRPLRVELPLAVLLPAPIVACVELFLGDGDTSSALTRATADAVGRGALYVLLHFGGVLALYLDLARWRPWTPSGGACSASRSCRGEASYFDANADMAPFVRRLRDDRPSLKVTVSLRVVEGEIRGGGLRRALERVLGQFEAPTGLKFELTEQPGGDLEVELSRMPGREDDQCAGLMRVAPAPDREGVMRVTIDSDRAPDFDYGTPPSMPGRLNFQRIAQHCVALALGAPPSIIPEDVTYTNFDRSSAPLELSAGVRAALLTLYTNKTARVAYTEGGSSVVRYATIRFTDATGLRDQKATFASGRPTLKWV